MEKPILSTRADDPEVSDLIDEFMVGLAEQVDRLQDAECKDDFETLGVLSCALAAEAEMLGFGVLAASATDTQSCCDTCQREDAREALIELTEIAKRIRMGHRGAV
jgi:hypothetical protein